MKIHVSQYYKKFVQCRNIILKTLCILGLWFFSGLQWVHADQIPRMINIQPLIIKQETDKEKERIQQRTPVETNITIENQRRRITRPVQQPQILRTQDSNRKITLKRLTSTKRLELKNKIKQLNLKIQQQKRKRQGLQRQLTDKKQVLIRTQDPVIRLQLQRELSGIQQSLDSSNFKLQEAEGQRTLFSLQLSSADYEGDEESIGGQGRWNTQGKQNACFIATAAYGSPLAKEVMIFRQFRDHYLLTHVLGRKFIQLYYQYSPPLAVFIANSDILRLTIRVMLWPLLVLIKYPVILLLCFGLLLMRLVTKMIVGVEKRHESKPIR